MLPDESHARLLHGVWGITWYFRMRNGLRRYAVAQLPRVGAAHRPKRLSVLVDAARRTPGCGIIPPDARSDANTGDVLLDALVDADARGRDPNVIMDVDAPDYGPDSLVDAHANDVADASVDSDPRDTSSDSASDLPEGQPPLADAASDGMPRDCLQNSDCGPNGYCYYALGRCSAWPALPGTCLARPQTCDAPYFPVCGCDSRMYPNSCVMAQAGVSPAQAGACSSW